MSEWNSRLTSLGDVWNNVVKCSQPQRNCCAKSATHQIKKIPLINFYCFAISIFSRTFSESFWISSSLKCMVFLVFYACRGKSWFDWIQKRHLLQGWNFCHKCKSPWWEPCWRGNRCSRVSLQVLWCNTLLLPHPHLGLRPAPHHITKCV